MPKMNMLKSIGIPVGAGLAGIGGGAVLGSELQKRRLVKAFNAYNQQENSAIAQNFFEQGAMAGMAGMGKKAAYLQQVTMAAFSDEMEKMGRMPVAPVNALVKGGKGLVKRVRKAVGKPVSNAPVATNLANVRQAAPASVTGVAKKAKPGAPSATSPENIAQQAPIRMNRKQGVTTFNAGAPQAAAPVAAAPVAAAVQPTGGFKNFVNQHKRAIGIGAAGAGVGSVGGYVAGNSGGQRRY
jgi:hypothetical protein